MNNKPYSKKVKKSFSYGILLFAIKDKEPIFLIQQQRDSYAFIELMQGKWSNDQQLKEKITNLTVAERYRILNYTYEELWYDLNISYKNINRKRYNESYEKFFMHRKKILNYLMSTPQMKNKQMLWSLPKGRKKSKEEEDRICAIREFKEETNIMNLEDIFLLQGFKINNSFMGEDGTEYINNFFVAEINYNNILPETKMVYETKSIRRSSISSEVENISWIKYDDIFKKVNINYHSVFVNFNYNFQYIHKYERIKLSNIYN